MSHATIMERVHHYRREGLAQVEGWFEAESAEVIAELIDMQLEAGVRGNVAEIGVHHGKSFLLFANGVRDDERAVALDVFDDQDLNLDNSGRGDRSSFEANVATWAGEVDVSIVQCSSLEVAPEAGPETFGRTRLFSVDGGHTAEITEHDLRIAQACTVDDGIVVLDDLLNSHWLGVLSGAAAYLRDGTGLVPFAFSPNKLYLTTSEAAARVYRDGLQKRLPDLLGKPDVEFFGRTIDVYGQGSARRNEQRHAQWLAAREEAARVAELERQVKDLRKKLRRERRERKQAQVERGRLTRHIRQVEASRSWRMTRLPRRLSGWARSRTR